MEPINDITSKDIETYNYSNFETAMAELWFSNNYYRNHELTQFTAEQVTECSTVSREDRYGYSIADSAVLAVSKAIQETMQGAYDAFWESLNLGVHEVGPYDLVRYVGSLSRVNTREIARTYVNEALIQQSN